MADDNVAVSEKKRGRPKSIDVKDSTPKKAEKRGKPAEDKKNAVTSEAAPPAKRGRGRPKGSGKKGKAKAKAAAGGGRGRGRPKKEDKVEKAAAESSGGDEEDDDDDDEESK